MIRERVVSWIGPAQATGKTLGRPRRVFRRDGFAAANGRSELTKNRSTAERSDVDDHALAAVSADE